jgi:ethanolamine ammonia-lyase small subunit
MSTRPLPLVVANPWQVLRRFTPARIALGRTGVSLPTDAHLAFQLAHARARDAVQVALDVPQLLQALEAAGIAAADEVVVLDSAATDRLTYLQRPDLGRSLSEASRRTLQSLPTAGAPGCDIAMVLADGLSALAVNTQAPLLLDALLPRLAAEGWQMAPITVVRQARVAIGDEIGALLSARMVVVLIGERPGLSAPDSMGVYLTWMPVPGVTDASRNCISNVRDAGLQPSDAATRVHYLMSEARRRQMSGVLLKDESSDGQAAIDGNDGAASFLLPLKC